MAEAHVRNDEFNSAVARHYDFYNTEEAARDDVNFILHYAVRANSVLDISAGTGRVALPLAERGLKVTCIEPSPSMVDALFAKVSQRPALHPFITILQDDPATFQTGKQHPLIYMLWTFFYIPTDAERLKVLKNLHKHVSDGGKLIIDTTLGTRPNDEPIEMGRYTIGDFEYRATIRAIREDGSPIYRGLTRIETWRDDALVRADECYFTAADVPSYSYFRGLLEEAGFEVEETWADSDFIPFEDGPDSRYAIVVARKR